MPRLVLAAGLAAALFVAAGAEPPGPSGDSSAFEKGPHGGVRKGAGEEKAEFVLDPAGAISVYFSGLAGEAKSPELGTYTLSWTEGTSAPRNISLERKAVEAAEGEPWAGKERLAGSLGGSVPVEWKAALEFTRHDMVISLAFSAAEARAAAGQTPPPPPPPVETPPPPDAGARRTQHASQFTNVGAKKARVEGKAPKHGGDLRALGPAHVEMVFEEGNPAKAVLYVTDPAGKPWPISDVIGEFYLQFSDGSKKRADAAPLAASAEGRWEAAFEPKGTWPPFALLHISIGDMRYDTGYGTKPGGKKKP